MPGESYGSRVWRKRVAADSGPSRDITVSVGEGSSGRKEFDSSERDIREMDTAPVRVEAPEASIDLRGGFNVIQGTKTEIPAPAQEALLVADDARTFAPDGNVELVKTPGKVALVRQGVSIWKFVKNIHKSKDDQDALEAKGVFLNSRNARKGKKAAVFGLVAVFFYNLSAMLTQSIVSWVKSKYPDLQIDPTVEAWVVSNIPEYVGGAVCLVLTYMSGRFENWLRTKHLKLWEVLK